MKDTDGTASGTGPVLVIHGIGSGLRDRSSSRSVEGVEVLASGGTEPAALGDLAADVEMVKQTVERIGEAVVLVGHSYGGMVITELADNPGVARSVYLAAVLPQQGSR